MLYPLGRKSSCCQTAIGARPVVALLALGFMLGLTNVSNAQSGPVERFSVDSGLHRAAHLGDVVSLHRELDAETDPNAINRFGVTPLSLACTGGHVEAITLLLNAGADPNHASPSGETPLMVAARTGVIDSVVALLEHGADPLARESWMGQTALMWAAAERHVGVIAPLVEAGADVNRRTDSGFTPLMFATRLGHIETVEALLDAGADIHQTLPDGTSALVVAVINAHYDLAVRLLERGAEPNAAEQGWTALHQLVWTRRPNTNKNQHNPSPRPRGRVTDLELVKALVAHGADVNGLAVDQHLVAAIDQLCHAFRRQTDTIFVVLDLFGATDFHDAPPSIEVQISDPRRSRGACNVLVILPPWITIVEETSAARRFRGRICGGTG